jgi:hypothetical protein
LLHFTHKTLKNRRLGDFFTPQTAKEAQQSGLLSYKVPQNSASSTGSRASFKRQTALNQAN